MLNVESEKIEYLRKLVYCLKSGAQFPQDFEDAEVLSAVYLASTKYEMQLNKKRLTELSEKCKELKTNSANQNSTNQQLVEFYELAELVFDEVLDGESVELFWDGSNTSDVRQKTKSLRFALPQIEEIINREARKVMNKLREVLPSMPCTFEDIRNDLYVYLFDNLEKNYKPERSPYHSYISMSISLRGKRIVSLYSKKYLRENVITAPEKTDFDTNEEFIDYLFILKSEITNEIEEYERSEFVDKLNANLKGYEKGMILLKMMNSTDLPLLNSTVEKALQEQLKKTLYNMLGEQHEKS